MSNEVRRYAVSFGPESTFYVDGICVDGICPLDYSKNATKAVAMVFRPPASLRVIGPNGCDPARWGRLAESAAPFSRFDTIRTTGAAQPPQFFLQLFGPEPTHGWRYYFQEACLAVQCGDWHGLARLADGVEQQRLTPNDVSEWLVFVEGLLRAGDFYRAAEWAKRAVDQMPILAKDMLELAVVCRLAPEQRSEWQKWFIVQPQIKRW